MAVEIIVDGPANIKVAAGVGALSALGYTADGAEISEHVATLDVKSDDNGGEAGPPVDVQYLGEWHEIRLRLTKYDEAVLNGIRARLATATAGTPGTPGTLMFTAAVAYRLCIHSTNRPRNYLLAIVRSVNEVNKGTKHSTAIVVFHAYKNSSGVIYNATTT